MNAQTIKPIVTVVVSTLVAAVTSGGVPTTWYQWLGLAGSILVGIAALYTHSPAGPAPATTKESTTHA